MNENNFKKPIDEVRKEVHPNLRLHPRAKLVLSRTLSNFNDQLVMAVKQSQRKSKKGTPAMQIVQEAIRPLLEPELLKHAFLRASMDVERFELGGLKYKHELLANKAEAASKKQPIDFAKGYADVFSEYTKGHSVVDRDTKYLGASVLYQLTLRLLDKVKEHPDDDGIFNAASVKLAVDDVLSPDLAQFANAEGLKMNLCYKEDLVDFKAPPDVPDSSSRRSPRKVAKAKKPSGSREGKKEREKATKSEEPSINHKRRNSSVEESSMNRKRKNSKEEVLPNNERTSSPTEPPAKKRSKADENFDHYERGLDLMMREMNADLKPDSRQLLVSYVANLAIALANNVPDGTGPITKEDVTTAVRTVLVEGHLRSHAENVGEEAVRQHKE